MGATGLYGAGTRRHIRAGRAALLASSALALASTWPAARPALAQDATWLGSPGTADFNTGANWGPGTVPTGTAFFGASDTTALSFSADTTVGGLTFNAGASAYSFTNSQNLNFDGAGIVVNGGSATVINDYWLIFTNASSAGSATMINNSFQYFVDTSTAGSATITSSGNLSFYVGSTAGSAAITNTTGYLMFETGSTAGNAIITNGNVMTVRGTAGSATIINNYNLSFITSGSAGNANITNNGTLDFSGFYNPTAGSATITNNNVVNFKYTGTAGNATITNNSGSITYFGDTSSGGSARLIANAGGVLDFSNLTSAGTTAGSFEGAGRFELGAKTLTVGGNGLSSTVSGVIADGGTGGGTGGALVKTGTGSLTLTGTSTYTGGTTITGGGLYLGDSVGTGKILNAVAVGASGTFEVINADTSGITSITNDGATNFRNSTSAGSAAITNTTGIMNFFDTSTAGSATITNNNGGATYFQGGSSGGSARLIANAGGVFDFSMLTFGMAAGSFEGAGRFELGARTLTVGGNGLSTTVSGVIADGGGGGGTGGALVKTGAGTLTLSGTNSYTGATTVDGGTLAVNSSITASSGVTVNSGGTLAGTGTVGNTTINNGGTLASGDGTVGSSMTVNGSLAFQSGAFYMVQLDPATSSLTNVTGAATLGGSTVKVVYANGSYLVKQYTILTAGSVSGAFASVAETNLPSNVHATLSHDATHAYLNLVLNFIAPPGSGLSGNQQKVGNTIVNYFNSNGGIPLVYSALTAGGLTQASGETAAGSQQTSFQAMTQFMGLLTDPFSAGRDTGASAAPAYAAENEPRDAYAMFAKAPLAKTYEPRWSLWAAGFAGSQTTDGNTALGSNSATSRLFGTAAGADYWFSASTLAGFALAGGGTSFSVVNGGSGRSDLFQAGAFVRHSNGPAYISVALAYGWQDVTTERTVTIAGVDRLRAEFNANAWSGRAEGGYRYVTPWAGGVGITPYAAAQFATFNLPAYAEQVVSGANTFALAYGSKSVTDTRSELGLRADKSFTMQSAVLTLRGRAAWAHDFNPDRAVGATFQALPGASFVVNGARLASELRAHHGIGRNEMDQRLVGGSDIRRRVFQRHPQLCRQRHGAIRMVAGARITAPTCA